MERSFEGKYFFHLYPMSVVNCKVQYIRPEYSNLKEWVSDPQNVYVGRAGIVFVEENGLKERFPKVASPFCNPFKVGKDGTLEEVVAKFRAYMVNRLDKEPVLVQQLLALEGKRLGCWCKPQSCHGDVLLDLIQLYKAK